MLLNKNISFVGNEFVRDYAAKITGSSLSKKYNLNQKTVSTLLLELEEKKIVTNKMAGKNKEYSLLLENTEIVAHFLACIEHTRIIELYKEKPFLKEICTKILPFCDGIVVLFGSYAKNREKEESDIDIFVVGTVNLKEIKKIGEVYNKEINVKLTSRSGFKKALQEKNYLFLEILRNHYILQNGEEWIRGVMRNLYGQN